MPTIDIEHRIKTHKRSNNLLVDFSYWSASPARNRIIAYCIQGRCSRRAVANTRQSPNNFYEPCIIDVCVWMCVFKSKPSVLECHVKNNGFWKFPQQPCAVALVYTFVLTLPCEMPRSPRRKKLMRTVCTRARWMRVNKYLNCREIRNANEVPNRTRYCV